MVSITNIPSFGAQEARSEYLKFETSFLSDRSLLVYGLDSYGYGL